jgi:hypothetical protein
MIHMFNSLDFLKKECIVLVTYIIHMFVRGALNPLLRLKNNRIIDAVQLCLKNKTTSVAQHVY